MTSAARASLQAKPASAGPAHGVLQRCGPASCDCPDRDDSGPLLRRSAVEPERADGRGVPPIVHEVLRSPGQQLATDVRTFYESRFGHDFSGVRLHADSKAADSASAVGAQAFTVGTDIVLGDGAKTALTAQPSSLLAHELAHVVQQSQGVTGTAAYSVEPADSPAEAEAVSAAAEVTAGRPPRVRARGARLARQMLCSEMAMKPGASVNGTAVEEEVRNHFVGVVGAHAWLGPGGTTMHRIQDATYAARRTQGYGSKQDTKVKPFVGGDPGTPDLAYKTGRRVELAELKPAEWGALAEGVGQVLNYLEHGNSEENRSWRRGLGLAASDAFSLMTPNRYTPPSQVSVGQQKIEVSWCLPGLLGYRALTPEEAETILCGVSDQKAIDKFLNVALNGAQALLDRFIDSSLDQQLTRLIQTLTLREGLAMLGRYGRDLLWDLLKSVGLEGEQVLDVLLGPAGTLLAGTSGSDALIDGAALLLEQILGPQAEALLRAVVFQAKSRLLADIRKYLKDRLRTYLQESLNAVCAAAAVGVTVSVAQLLRQFSRDLGKRFSDAVVDVALAWAAELAKEFAKDLGYALLIAIAVVALIFFLPAILAALAAAGEFAIAAAAALAALGPRLAPLLDQLVQELQAAF